MFSTSKKSTVIKYILYISLGILILTILFLQSSVKATPAHAASCSGGFSTSQINSYLACYGSPMNGMGSSFVTYGQKYNVDPRFMVAIAGAETSFGRNLCTSYNPFNWFFNKWCNSPYSSWDSAINSVTAGVGNNYLQKGQTTISSFVYSCGTHCYCQNCTNWYNNVRAFYSQQGGNPDTHDLTYNGNQGGSGTVFSSGWENGQANGYQNLVMYSRSVAGYYNSSNPPPEAGRVTLENWATPNVHGGSYYLRVAGYSQASYAYVYFKLFDTNIKIQNGMKLRYWIYTYQGTTFAMDGHFTDGNTMRDLNNGGYLTDQNGRRIHPAYQGSYSTRTWRYVEVDLSKAYGKTLDYLMVAFDNGNNGFKGQIRAYIDDVSIGY